MDSSKSLSNKTYEYHPKSEWVHDKDNSILQIELPEFKKEELKVQIDHMGNLRIIGEHQIDGSKSIRFCQSHRVPENSKHDQIKAKFERGVLYINVLLSKPEEKQLGDSDMHQPHRLDQTESIQVRDTITASGGKEEARGARLGTGNSHRSKTWKRQIVSVVVGFLVLAALVGLPFMVHRLMGSVEEGSLLDFLDWENC